jgi:hypothetical protein
MPVPIPGLKVGSDNKKFKFLTIFGRPKTGIFGEFRSVPGGPKALDMDTLAARTHSTAKVFPEHPQEPEHPRGLLPHGSVYQLKHTQPPIALPRELEKA